VRDCGGDWVREAGCAEEFARQRCVSGGVCVLLVFVSGCEPQASHPSITIQSLAVARSHTLVRYRP
jgi:hypothetical protein